MRENRTAILTGVMVDVKTTLLNNIIDLENVEKRRAFGCQYLQKTSPNTLIGLKGDFSAP